MNELTLFSEFSLLRPEALLLLLFLPVLAWGLQRRSPHRKNPWRDHIDPDLLEVILPQAAQKSSKKPRRSTILGLIFGLLAVLALAGPSLHKTEVPTAAPENEAVILLGLSPSMMAQDLTPDRLTRTRIALEEWMREREGDDVGLATFAGTAFRVSPLTRDQATLLHLINTIQPDVLPRAGHSLKAGIDVALELFSGNPAHRTLLIVSDQNLSTSDRSLLKKLTRQNIQVQMLGVGTAAGAPVPLASGRFATQANGQLALAEVDLESQSRLAKEAGAAWQDVRHFDAHHWRSTSSSSSSAEQDAALNGEIAQDDGYWLLLPLLGLAAWTFRRGALWLLLLFCLPFPVPSSAAEAPGWLLNEDQRTLRNWREAPDADRAASISDPRWRGVARFKQGDFANAEGDFSSGQTLTDRYNKALTQAHLDNIDDAIKGFQDVLNEDPDFADARQNLEVLERVKQQQQQSGQNSKSQGGGDSEQDGESSSGDSADSEQNQSAEDSENSESSSSSGSEQSGAESSDQPSQSDAAQNSSDAPDGEQDAQSGADSESSPSQAESSKDGGNAKDQSSESASLSADSDSRAETERNLRQWLRRVDSDPALLLRERFRRLEIERERDQK